MEVNKAAVKRHLVFAERHRLMASSYFKGGIDHDITLYLNKGVEHTGFVLMSLSEAIQELAELDEDDRKEIEETT